MYIEGFVLLIISDLTYSEICKLRNNCVLFLNGSMGQEFGQGIAGVSCLCFTIAGATAGKTQMTGSDINSLGLE